jgi:3-hydroxyacyl-CoA dehydrogenase/3-hydroxy-2-methylbutyryl-CoA dehydrogenase
MTLPMARDLGRYGVRVNTIAPSLFMSPMAERMSEKVRKNLIQDVVFPKRFGEAEEFAEMVKFIIEHSYMNGETYRLIAGSRLSGRL